MAILRRLLPVLLIFMTACNTVSPTVNNERSEDLEATDEKPSDSPDGKHRLVVLIGHDGEARYKTFQILRNNNGTQKNSNKDSTKVNSKWLTVYTSTDRFPARFVNYFLWDAKNRVWAYNSDIGSYFYWQSDSRDQWKKNVYLDQSSAIRPPLPPLLQRNYDDVQNKIKKS
jgi:hypothetical protein